MPDPNVWTGRASQEAFRDDEVGLALMYPALRGAALLAIMDIRAHPGLTSGKTSVGHLGTQSCGCAGQTVRPSPSSSRRPRRDSR